MHAAHETASPGTRRAMVMILVINLVVHNYYLISDFHLFLIFALFADVSVWAVCPQLPNAIATKNPPYSLVTKRCACSNFETLLKILSLLTSC